MRLETRKSPVDVLFCLGADVPVKVGRPSTEAAALAVGPSVDVSLNLLLTGDVLADNSSERPAVQEVR